MIDGKRVLGLIPARGGSKRLPRKNLSPLRGRPLIAYTIEAGLASPFLDELLVSTDDAEIAEVARSYGAKAPFLRPAALALDHSGTFEVIQHALEYCRGRQQHFDYLVYLQPTSPLREAEDINEALRLLRQKEADAVISVAQPDHTPLWCNTLPESLSMTGFLREEVKNKRSQDLESYYRLNGAIYIIDIARLQAEKTFFLEEKIFAYIMPPERSVDIDSALDLKLCELLLAEKNGGCQ